MEAISVTELHNVAAVLEGHDGSRLHGDLICDARAVISDEWPAMERGESSASVEHWVDTVVTDFAATDPTNPKQEAAYGQWFDQQAERRESAVIQAVPIAFVSALVTSALLVVGFLDHPYDNWTGSLQPDQMRVTLTLIDDGHIAPCTSRGDPT